MEKQEQAIKHDDSFEDIQKQNELKILLFYITFFNNRLPGISLTFQISFSECEV